MLQTKVEQTYIVATLGKATLLFKLLVLMKHPTSPCLNLLVMK